MGPPNYFDTTWDNEVQNSDIQSYLIAHVQHLKEALGSILKCCDVTFQAVEQLLVMSTQNLILVEHHSMMIKYRIHITDISAMSVSPNPDKVIVFHLQKVHSHICDHCLKLKKHPKYIPQF